MHLNLIIGLENLITREAFYNLFLIKILKSHICTHGNASMDTAFTVCIDF